MTKIEDNEFDISYLSNQTVGVVGYGIQGEAQAKNLRDSGVNVIVANQNDEYREKAIKDGFEIIRLDKICSISDIVMLLIPDSAHLSFINNFLNPSYKSKLLLVVAHGYSLRFQDLMLPEDLDIAMIAPRYPGRQIRDTYVDGSGVPAFVDFIKDFSGDCKNRTLALCKAIGFAEAGVLKVSYKEEAEVDLFIEQFMAPLFYSAVENAMEMLVDRGYSNIVASLELYFSGELGAVRTMMAKNGMYGAFKNNASPTCQFGVASNIESIFTKEMRLEMNNILDNIVSGRFAKDLQKEEADGYPEVKAFFEKRKANLVTNSENEVISLIKRPT